MVQQPEATANRWLQVGLGWHRSPLAKTGNHIWWHNGATAGSHSYLAFMPAGAAGVIVLSNTGRPVDALGVRLMQALASPPRPADDSPPTHPAPRSRWSTAHLR